MLTREQIEEIQGEAREKGIAIKALLKEKGIPEHQYFWWKRKYARAEVPDGFLPIAGGGLPAGMEATAAFAASRGKTKGAPTGENRMGIELRTVAGTDMRIQGGLTPCDGAHNPQKRIGHVQSWRRSEVLALHEADGHAQELQHAERDSEQRHASEPVRRGCLRVRERFQQHDEAAALRAGRTCDLQAMSLL